MRLFVTDDLNLSTATGVISGMESVSLIWGARLFEEHSASLGLWRHRTFPYKTPSPTSPSGKSVGCAVDGAISTEFILNNPLPQDGKGRVSWEKRVFREARLKSEVLVGTKRLFRSLCAAALPLGINGSHGET